MSEKPKRRKLTFGTGIFVGLLLDWPLRLMDRWMVGHYSAVEPALRIVVVVSLAGLAATIAHAALHKRRHRS